MVPTELAHASIRHRPAKPPPYQLNGRDGPPVLTLSRTGTLHLILPRTRTRTRTLPRTRDRDRDRTRTRIRTRTRTGACP